MTSPATVVVAYDGSEDSGNAVRWAAQEAGRRSAPLRVVSVIPPVTFVALPYPDSLNEGVPQEAEKLAQEGAAAAREYGATDVSAAGFMGEPAAILVDQSGSAGLLVTGSRGHRPLASALIGSVAYAVSAHAACPVVVVRGDLGPDAGEGPVVVGYDGSEIATRAVDFAADQAARAGRELRIVTVWFDTTEAAAALTTVTDLRTQLTADAAHVARLAGQRALQRHPQLVVSEVACEGLAAREMLAQAHDASLLVTGTRGHGGFAGLLLGSVSHAVLGGARCPIAVVR
ncbi:universal stress protein [Flexivirga caeni]|uniref:universal stress protein n=1 Tax=Flexivirga caeni TaxID=2294115 RepID=UPI0011CE2058|nr:universal stress protein [Flexivirga caeni]